ncbi:hypothetical protein XELAEV_18023222mg [Xenopus laevis]|uniref:Uncharacterized protein n=1 Tax=Xenopus laevis TaxID=8355 RepID=A0A974D3R8_XENLA|nr:hypothetical protein XELAEV_18023222mg [Xenopus laevis]
MKDRVYSHLNKYRSWILFSSLKPRQSEKFALMFNSVPTSTASPFCFSAQMWADRSLAYSFKFVYENLCIGLTL